MQIKYTGEYSYSVITTDGKRVTFQKGNNFIEDRFWDEIKNNPLVKERLTSGILLLVVSRTEDTEIIDEIKKIETPKVAETQTETKTENETETNPKIGTETNIDMNNDTDPAELEIENLNIQQATELIKQCVSEDMLTKLLEKDKRAGIKDAINAQLKRLKEVENV